MSEKTLLFALGALALAACADSTAPARVDPEMLVRPPLETTRPQQIVFTSSGVFSNDIYTMNPDGSGTRRLTSNVADDQQPALSPDGSKVAFRSTRNNGGYEIYVMDARGESYGLVRLTWNAAIDEEPTWSPDGTQIAFTRAGDLYVMSAYGGERDHRAGYEMQRLTWEGRGVAYPTWSPDGSKIAFAFTDHGSYTSDIYVNDPTTGFNTRLTWVGSASQPAWSPNGLQIAFVKYGDGNVWNSDIYVMNATDGSGMRLLTPNTGTVDDYPAWSPDGSKIAYATRDPYDGPNIQIAVMNLDGSAIGNLTSGTQPSWGWAPVTSAP